MRLPGQIPPLGINPNVAGTAGAATSALSNDARHAVIDSHIHYVIPDRPGVHFPGAVRLDKGDVDSCLKTIHGIIIPVVEFP